MGPITAIWAYASFLAYTGAYVIPQVPSGSVYVKEAIWSDHLCGLDSDYLADYKGNDYFIICTNGLAREYRCLNNNNFDFNKLTCKTSEGDESDSESWSLPETDNRDEAMAAVIAGASYIESLEWQICTDLGFSSLGPAQLLKDNKGEDYFVFCSLTEYYAYRYRCSTGKAFDYVGQQCIDKKWSLQDNEEVAIPEGATYIESISKDKCKNLKLSGSLESDSKGDDYFIFCGYNKLFGERYLCPIGNKFIYSEQDCRDWWLPNSGEEIIPKGSEYVMSVPGGFCGELGKSPWFANDYWGIEYFIICHNTEEPGSRYKCRDGDRFNWDTLICEDKYINIYAPVQREQLSNANFKLQDAMQYPPPIEGAEYVRGVDHDRCWSEGNVTKNLLGDEYFYMCSKLNTYAAEYKCIDGVIDLEQKICKKIINNWQDQNTDSSNENEDNNDSDYDEDDDSNDEYGDDSDDSSEEEIPSPKQRDDSGALQSNLDDDTNVNDQQMLAKIMEALKDLQKTSGQETPPPESTGVEINVINVNVVVGADDNSAAVKTAAEPSSISKMVMGASSLIDVFNGGTYKSLCKIFKCNSEKM